MSNATMIGNLVLWAEREGRLPAMLEALSETAFGDDEWTPADAERHRVRFGDPHSFYDDPDAIDLEPDRCPKVYRSGVSTSRCEFPTGHGGAHSWMRPAAQWRAGRTVSMRSVDL